jgi:glucokinase
LTTLGVDVGGTKVLGVALDEAGSVVAEHRVPTPRGSEALVDDLLDVVALLRAEVPGVVAVGVGLPGLVDRSGALRFAPNLPGVVELPVGAMASAATGLPVVVDNDATCATWAEHLVGAARGAADVLLVTLGTGIGGGLVLDGRLARGANGFAGEIGHMVVDADGIACVCGRRGCWERYASGSGLGRMAREAAEAGRGVRMVDLAGGNPDLVRGEHATAAALEGDREAMAVVDRFAGWFAIGLANLVHVLDVQTCVIGGGLVEAGDVVLGPIRRQFVDRVFAPEHRPAVDIVPAQLGERAGAIGAALLAAGARG